MCQISHKLKDFVEQLTEPMRVYKIVKMHINGKLLSSYYQNMRVEIGKTYVSPYNFMDDVEMARDKVNSYHQSWFGTDKFELRAEGFHSLVSASDANNLILGHIRDVHIGRVVECEIPAGAYVIRGVFSDITCVKTVVSNAVKYVKLVD